MKKQSNKETAPDRLVEEQNTSMKNSIGAFEFKELEEIDANWREVEELNRKTILISSISILLCILSIIITVLASVLK